LRQVETHLFPPQNHPFRYRNKIPNAPCGDKNQRQSHLIRPSPPSTVQTPNNGSFNSGNAWKRTPQYSTYLCGATLIVSAGSYVRSCLLVIQRSRNTCACIKTNQNGRGNGGPKRERARERERSKAKVSFNKASARASGYLQAGCLL